MKADDYGSFGDVKARLEEIVDAVNAEGLSLDDALTLYEEAVSLGLRASDLLEVDITEEEAAESASAEPSVASPAQPATDAVEPSAKEA